MDSNPPLHRFQFSLWGLLIIVTLCSVAATLWRVGSAVLLIGALLIWIAGLGIVGWAFFWCVARVAKKEWPSLWRVPKWVFQALMGFLLLAGVFHVSIWIYDRFTARDQRLITYQYGTFCEAVHKEKWEEAYACMTPIYRQTHSLSDFRDWTASEASPLSLCDCVGPEPLIRVLGSYANFFPSYDSEAFWEQGVEYHLEKIDGHWYFTGEIERHYLD